MKPNYWKSQLKMRARFGSVRLLYVNTFGGNIMTHWINSVYHRKYRVTYRSKVLTLEIYSQSNKSQICKLKAPLPLISMIKHK